MRILGNAITAILCGIMLGIEKRAKRRCSTFPCGVRRCFIAYVVTGRHGDHDVEFGRYIHESLCTLIVVEVVVVSGMYGCDVS